MSPGDKGRKQAVDHFLLADNPLCHFLPAHID
jgi:hypothetical protein